DHDGVLPRFDHLVEIADRAGPHRERQRPVLPYRLAAAHAPAAGEIAGGEIVVTRDRHHGPPEPPRHLLDDARLAAAGGALEHDGEAAIVALREDAGLVRGSAVEGRPVGGPQCGVIAIPGGDSTGGEVAGLTATRALAALW